MLGNRHYPLRILFCTSMYDMMLDHICKMQQLNISQQIHETQSEMLS